jgi:hypothetical protein
MATCTQLTLMKDHLLHCPKVQNKLLLPSRIKFTSLVAFLLTNMVTSVTAFNHVFVQVLTGRIPRWLTDLSRVLRLGYLGARGLMPPLVFIALIQLYVSLYFLINAAGSVTYFTVSIGRGSGHDCFETLFRYIPGENEGNMKKSTQGAKCLDQVSEPSEYQIQIQESFGLFVASPRQRWGYSY